MYRQGLSFAYFFLVLFLLNRLLSSNSASLHARKNRKRYTFDGKQEKYNTSPERRELRKNKIRYLIRCRTRQHKSFAP